MQMAKMGKVALLGQSSLEERLELAEHQVKLEQEAFLVFLEWPEPVEFLEVLEHRARQGMQAFLMNLERTAGVPGAAGAGGAPGSSSPGAPSAPAGLEKGMESITDTDVCTLICFAIVLTCRTIAYPMEDGMVTQVAPEEVNATVADVSEDEISWYKSIAVILKPAT
ncbi:hypothetical protein DAPPUDRAFT_250683 [Daphnia pulex]|uniref:Uncharacterized protein n=1 Tax=Daphnia pulex TaxID=6669 RepID=E9GZ42_DAPPU|nr:hypothetical protein DAPPUDRAFT_250683 [Daphnia pulex]|eukprot:EFX75264.1 hypothetical protein DAPPUDRAFT_250683 [Daphnia pulex]